MQKEIFEPHKVLKECILTDSQRVAIRNEIGELEDHIALIEFEDQPTLIGDTTIKQIPKALTVSKLQNNS